MAIDGFDVLSSQRISQSSLMARLILGPSGVPILGGTLMRLRSRFVSNRIMEGGVVSADALSPALKKELYDVGTRRGHYQGFLSLLSFEEDWSNAPSEYSRIRVPTLLIYGEHHDVTDVADLLHAEQYQIMFFLHLR